MIYDTVLPPATMSFKKEETTLLFPTPVSAINNTLCPALINFSSKYLYLVVSTVGTKIPKNGVLGSNLNSVIKLSQLFTVFDGALRSTYVPYKSCNNAVNLGATKGANVFLQYSANFSLELSIIFAPTDQAKHHTKRALMASESCASA